MYRERKRIAEIINNAVRRVPKRVVARPEADVADSVKWPMTCTVGPGLEGAIACESKIGYVDGSRGILVYRGYDIFDLCANSTFEEVCYLLLKGSLPTRSRLEGFKRKLVAYRTVSKTLRLLMGFPVEKMNAMAALRMGTNLMRQEFTYVDQDVGKADISDAIAADEDSLPMDMEPKGEERAAFEFRKPRSKKLKEVEQTIDSGTAKTKKLKEERQTLEDATSTESCCHLIAGVPTIAAAISRIREGKMPVEPDPELSHAANYLYMLTGRRPDPIEERIMDVALILHADHGMNASTFAAMVVASTLSDIYLSIGAGIAALTGPLHGGANEQVIKTLESIGDPARAREWFERARAKREKIMGFGHRVYNTYDPRARILGPLADYLTRDKRESRRLFLTAKALEREVVSTLGAAKGIFPNVDFYSGIVYRCLGMPSDLFTPTFAVSRVAGWSARVLEYLRNNRIFRPRAVYVGPLNRQYAPIEQRARKRRRKAKPRGRSARASQPRT